jgi:hypothetical protein
MNFQALTALIADLYAQLEAATARIRELEAEAQAKESEA